MSIRESIVNYAKSINIDCIGFSNTSFNKSFIERLKLKRELEMLSGFEEENELKRVDIEALLKGSNTLISIALPYKYKDIDKSKPYISKYTLGEDYHKVLIEKLQMIEKFINSNYNSSCMLYCDVGVLSDKEIARKSGIGFQGKNTNIITKQYGSFIFLGEIITTLKIEPSEEIANECGDCRICVNACPAKALSDNGIDGKRCLSYITQKKEELTRKEMDMLGTRVFGCDTCQDVCPYNKGKKISNVEEFKPVDFLLNINIEEILFMTNKEFKNKYGKYALAWRGKHIIQRNLIIAAGNSNNKFYVDILKKKKDDLRLKKYVDIALEKLESYRKG